MVRHRGFTLLEVLVVIAIIGLTASFVTLPLDDRRQAAKEVERLRLALEAAAEQADIRGTPIQVEFLPGAYRISRFDAQGNWIPVSEPSILAGQRHVEGLEWLDLRIDGKPVSRRLVFGAVVPEFVLRVRVPSGSVELHSLPTGAVRLRNLTEGG